MHYGILGALAYNASRGPHTDAEPPSRFSPYLEAHDPLDDDLTADELAARIRARLGR